MNPVQGGTSGERANLPVPVSPVSAPTPVKPKRERRQPVNQAPIVPKPPAPNPGQIIDTYAKDLP